MSRPQSYVIMAAVVGRLGGAWKEHTLDNKVVVPQKNTAQQHGASAHYF